MNTACLAPNGMSVYRGEGAASRLLVGTAKGVAVLERAPGQDWRLTGTELDGKHISSLLIEPVNGGVYAGVHRGGVFFSPDQGRTWEPRSDGHQHRARLFAGLHGRERQAGRLCGHRAAESVPQRATRDGAGKNCRAGAT